MRALLVALLLAVLWPTSAFAAGSLVISLQDDHGRAVEGTVTATPAAGGQARTCATHGGRCTLSVPAGRYLVGATLIRGGFVPASSVTVQDGRAASVRLSALPPPTAAPMQQTTGQGGPANPVVPGGGAQGGTHPPAGGGQGVVVQGGPNVALQGARAPGFRPVVPGQGPPPVVVTPGHPQPVGSTMSVQGAAVNPGAAPRNLGTGQRASVLGTAQDQRGRRVEGSVTVTQAGRTIGTVSTTGGSFTCFDLPAGSYNVSFRALTGQQASRDVVVGAGPAVSVRLSVTR